MSFLDQTAEAQVTENYRAPIRSLVRGWSDEEIQKLENGDREAMDALEQELIQPDHCVDSELYGVEIW